MLATLLALTHARPGLMATLDESPTFDEPTHLTAGYSYWLKHDYRLDPENGNLPARWAALPLLLRDGIRFPAENSAAWQHASVGLTSRQFFWELGNDAETMIRLGRLMMSDFRGRLVPADLCLGALAFRNRRRSDRRNPDGFRPEHARAQRPGHV